MFQGPKISKSRLTFEVARRESLALYQLPVISRNHLSSLITLIKSASIFPFSNFCKEGMLEENSSYPPPSSYHYEKGLLLLLLNAENRAHGICTALSNDWLTEVFVIVLSSFVLFTGTFLDNVSGISKC